MIMSRQDGLSGRIRTGLFILAISIDKGEFNWASHPEEFIRSLYDDEDLTFDKLRGYATIESDGSGLVGGLHPMHQLARRWCDPALREEDRSDPHQVQISNLRDHIKNYLESAARDTSGIGYRTSCMCG